MEVCLMAKNNNMKKIFAVLTFIGVWLVAIHSNAQTASVPQNATKVESTKHVHEHQSHKGGHHKRGLRIFHHHKHHGKHGNHDHVSSGEQKRGSSKGQSNQNKK